jgi:hypothetical protein
MRPGELINLQQPQLDHAAGYVKVMRHQDLGLESTWDRKTKNEVHVPIDAALWPYFGAGAAGWVFEGYNQRDPRERVKQLSRDWRRALRKANASRAAAGKPLIPDISPHDCKHTFVTRALEAGRPPQQVADITGTNLATLMRNYRHIINRAPRSAAATLLSVQRRFQPQRCPNKRPRRDLGRPVAGAAPSRKAKPAAGIEPATFRLQGGPGPLGDPWRRRFPSEKARQVVHLVRPVRAVAPTLPQRF